ncbi:hypothetical protein ACOACQ_17710 [Nocardioides sp. CPCC 206347]|uniref:hypothetical protein n=1 Tax=unclassified Nocardioides TaxID=2615069 RepID=UPI00360B1182
MNSSNWDYKVPRLAGSGFKSNVVTDLDHPTIGVYCEGIEGARHDLFLVGSFSVSGAVLEQNGTVHWGWNASYVTGDGYVIYLRRQAGAHAPTYLVDDQVWDADAERKKLLALGDDLFGKAHADQSARMDHANEVMRSMPNLLCRAHITHGKRCRMKTDARNERVQDVLTWLWQQGFREVSLESIGLAYRSVASHIPADE